MGKKRVIKNNDTLIQLSIDHYFCSGKLTGYKTKQSFFHKINKFNIKRAMDETIELDSDGSGYDHRIKSEVKKAKAPVKIIQISKSPPLTLKPKQKALNIMQSVNDCFKMRKISIEDSSDSSDSSVKIINCSFDSSTKAKINSNGTDDRFNRIDRSLKAVENLTATIKNESMTTEAQIERIDSILDKFSNVYEILKESPLKKIKVEKDVIKVEANDDVSGSSSGTIEQDDVHVLEQKYPYVNSSRSQESLSIKSEIIHLSQEVIIYPESESGSNLEDDRLHLFYKIVKFVKSAPNLYSVYPECDKKILETFIKLPCDYQYIIFKLYTRQEKWQRVMQFITNINVKMDEDGVFQMMNVLKDNEFIATDYSEEQPVDLLFSLLVDEVRLILKDYNIKLRKRSKPDMINAILKNCSTQMTLTTNDSSHSILYNKIRKIMGPCFRLKKPLQSALYRLHLLYSFTNNNISKTSDLYHEMIDIDNRSVTLPKYKCNNETPIFNNEEEFLKFSFAREIFDQYSIEREKKNYEVMWSLAETAYTYFLKALLSKPDCNPKFLIRYTAGNVLCTIITYACEDFANKKTIIVKEWLKKMLYQKIYGRRKHGRWHTLLALIAENQDKDVYRAAEIIIEGLLDPEVTLVYQHELSQRGLKLINRKTNCISEDHKRIINIASLDAPDSKLEFPCTSTEAKAERTTKAGAAKLYQTTTDEGDVYLKVEEVAIEYYKNNGYPSGVHCEGQLILTSLFLLFRDIIFDSDIPGVFVSEIQKIPLDLYSHCFYESRKTQIDNRLEDIGNKWSKYKLDKVLKENLDEYLNSGTAVSQIYIAHPKIIYDMIACLGRQALSKIYERIIKNFTFQSGMPDLFVWNFKEKKCKFVEVKSQNDRLSITQKLWLRFLLDVGVDAEICYVNSTGSRVKRGIKRTVEN